MDTGDPARVGAPGRSGVLRAFAASSPAAPAVLLLLAAIVGLAIGTRSYDDAYITYAFAKSVAAGDGLAFNGEHVLGTSTPFLALVLGGLERLAPVGIPVWGAVLTAAAGAVTALALLGIGRREGWAVGGCLAGALWILWPARFSWVGSEVGMAIAAVAAAALAFVAGRPVAAGASLALAAALRGEAVLAAPVLAGALALRDGFAAARRPVLRAAAVAATLGGVWIIALYTLAGAVVPSTLAAKRALAASALHVWDDAGLGLLAAEARGLAAIATSELAPVVALALAGAVVVVRRRRTFAAALALWGVGHLLLMAALGVPRYGWYALPVGLTLVLLAGLAAEIPSELPAPAAGRAAITLGALALFVLAGTVGRAIDRASDPGDQRLPSYRAAAELADRYPHPTRLASFEVGYLGYFSRQPIGDLLGLVSKEAPLDAVRRGDLAASRERLDPGLLMLPLRSGSLFASTIGEPRRFLAEWRLDALILEGRQVAVYRRAELPGRGEVALDLLPPLAQSGARVKYEGLEDGGGLTLVLGPGEWQGVPSIQSGRRRFFAGLAGIRGGAAMGEVSLRSPAGRVRSVTVARAAGARWRRFDARLGRVDAGDWVVLRCRAESEVSCLFGQPHLVAVSRRRGG